MLHRILPINERIFHGKRFQFLALSREEIKHFTSESPYLIIYVTDPNYSDAEIAESPNLIDIIRLKFDDVGKPSKFQFEETTDISMSETQAKQILEFVKKYLSEVKLIVCQCEQGMSRSPAMAGALSRILQNEDEYFLQNYWANRWVYDLLIESAKDFEY
ncbi:MAG TPA: hypothetical protein PKY82_10860 [Pyrinomonadaceae bacterium]|nr:hypothetical protein [Pyrinomonadaceae bacterium]